MKGVIVNLVSIKYNTEEEKRLAKETFEMIASIKGVKLAKKEAKDV